MSAKKDRSRYKSTNAWLDAVYRNNKEKIDAALDGDGELMIAGFSSKSNKAVFKQIMREYIAEGRSPEAAIKTYSRTSSFMSRKEHLLLNMYEGVKQDKEAFKLFREITKDKGKYTKFSNLDINRFRWDSEEKVYSVDNKWIIKFQNSPYGVTIYRKGRN